MDTLEYIEAAAKLETAGDWQGLHEFATRWVHEQPNSLFAWQSLGNALRNLGKMKDAIAAYKQGIVVAPREPIDFFGKRLTAGSLWFSLAHVHADQGNYELAKAAFREAATIDPNVVDIWNDLGVVCMNSRDTKGAFDAFMQAVTIDGTNINSLKNLGAVYAICKMEDCVQTIHQILLRLDPAQAALFLTKAKQLLAQ